jgi:cytochrome c oxidase cbb3-type subunit III
MPSRCLNYSGWLLLSGALLTACDREERRFREAAPASAAINSVALSDLQPGVTTPRVTASHPYDENAYAISEGKRLFEWFNCSGCHSQGGGGIGPPLMDDKWVYGNEPANIFATIVEGRPNGMPSFRGRIPPQQVWQLAAYVRSMSGQLRKDVEPGRSDDMNAGPAPSTTPKEEPKRGAVSGSGEGRQ